MFPGIDTLLNSFLSDITIKEIRIELNAEDKLFILTE